MLLTPKSVLNSALILHPEQIVGKPSITRVGKDVHEANISQSISKIETYRSYAPNADQAVKLDANYAPA